MLASCPGIVSADPVRLQQIPQSLLSNAVKFTPRGGRVEVRLACSQAHAQIQIIDTGKGIEPQFLTYIFDRFRQAEGICIKGQTASL